MWLLSFPNERRFIAAAHRATARYEHSSGRANDSIYDGGSKGSGGVDSHGTHVTGTIGAEGGNATGVAGVNWAVSAISGKSWAATAA